MTTSPETATPPVPTDAAGRDWPVVAAVAVTVVAWASAFVGIRFVGREFTPGALTLGRLLVGAVGLTLLVVPRGPRGTRPRRLVAPVRREWVQLVFIGLAWFAVYNLALNAGERRVDAGTASMLVQLGPILIGVLAGVLLREGFPRPLVVGGLVACAGAVLIGIATSTGRASLTGVLLVMLAAAVYAAAMVTQKVVLRRISGLQVTWIACLVGLLACLPFAGAFVRELAAASGAARAGLVYLGLVPTAIAFSTWAYALSKVSAGQLGITTFLVPPIAVLLGWALLGEVPAGLALVGGAVSLVGVAITRTRRPVGPFGRLRGRRSTGS